MPTRDEDLNHLTVFEALMETRSVSKASERLGLSQSAMSHTLAKMRRSFDDPLFIRVKNEMVPTPHAQRVAGSVRQVLELARGEIFRRQDFDPARADREFTVCMSDIAAMAYLPLMVRSIRAEAPRVRVRTVSPMAEKLEEGLESGSVDLAIGYFPDITSAGVFQQRLLRSSEFVCVASSDNERVRAAGMTLDVFEASPHVAVRTEGRSHEMVERSMEELGVRREVVVTVPHFLSLLGLIPGTDLVSIIPFDLSPGFTQMPGLALHRLPFESPYVKVMQIWHQRFHKDAASQWLRALTRRSLQAAHPSGSGHAADFSDSAA